jgi:ankyrin repeat domain-containing protein 17
MEVKNNSSNEDFSKPAYTSPPQRVVAEGDSCQQMDVETQNRLRAFLEVAGVKLSHVDNKTFQDPEVLRKLTNCVSNALDEAAIALNRMRSKQQNQQQHVPSDTPTDVPTPHEEPLQTTPLDHKDETTNQLVQSTCNAHQFSDIQALQQLLGQAGQGIHETTEDGETLLSLACSAGYFELAEVLLRMRASVEDRGVKGDSTPLMEAASGGYADIVKLLIDHGAKINATSRYGNESDD